jgi:thioredoxin-related protein
MDFMKTTLFLAVTILSLSLTERHTDFDKAKQEAKQEHKFILLNFSGSDWCGPCIRMHKDIFSAASFENFAGTNLVLVNADFPRLKKDRLPTELQEQNDHLADIYNKTGSFPCTVLLNAEGKVLHSWEGYPPLSADKFVEQLKEFTDAGK